MFDFRFLFFSLLVIAACAPTPKTATNQADTQVLLTATEPAVVLGSGDVVDVKFRFWPELDYQQSIRPDGKISLQLVDEVMAAGLTPEGLDQHLTELYSTKLKSPEITVIVISQANQNVYVGGEVEAPGLLPLVGSMSALQAVINAGGLKETAAPESVLVIRKGINNEPVPIVVDLNKSIYSGGSGSDILLKATDVVYIPKSSIAKANKFVREYIQDLFLFKGVSFGFNYDLDDNNN